MQYIIFNTTSNSILLLFCVKMEPISKLCCNNNNYPLKQCNTVIVVYICVHVKNYMFLQQQHHYPHDHLGLLSVTTSSILVMVVLLAYCCIHFKFCLPWRIITHAHTHKTITHTQDNYRLSFEKSCHQKIRIV